MDNNSFSALNRRDFIKSSMMGIASFSVLNDCNLLLPEGGSAKTKIALVKTTDRAAGVKEAMRLLDFKSPKNKNVVLKPNFNSADETPGSTHNDTLSQIVKELQARDALNITLGERSARRTKQNMTDKGIFDLAKQLDFNIVNFDEIGEDDWVHCNPEGNHWENGFSLPRLVVESEYLVSTCCLKTHGFGGHFTMSLKLAVGMTPKSLMGELHGKSRTVMRDMIAEINQGYKPELIVMDGVNAFVDGGPSSGPLKYPGVIVSGTDRVAVDAVGVAILKEQGSNDTIMGRKVFEHDQLRRAVEVGLGIISGADIDFVTSDAAGADYAEKLSNILKTG